MMLEPLRGRAWWEIFRSLESALEGVYGIPVSCIFLLPTHEVCVFILPHMSARMCVSLQA